MSCRELRVVDLYSGIGGLHTALCSTLCRLKVAVPPTSGESLGAVSGGTGRCAHGAGIVPQYKVGDVRAFDVNVVANSVYEHNFQLKPSTRGIDALAASHVRGSNLWLMSPPCQPYTRIGKQRDVEDARAASFLHMINLLDHLEQPPEFLFLENVKNFEHSETRTRLMAVLQRRNYNVQEFLVSPTQLGIPNTRLRYYLLARRRQRRGSASAASEANRGSAALEERSPSPSTHPSASSVQHGLPRLPRPLQRSKEDQCAMRRMGEFLDTSLAREDVQELILGPETLKRAGDFRFDVVTQASRASTTFAKGYGVKGHFRGSGPVLLLNPHDLSPAATDPCLHTPREAAKHQHTTSKDTDHQRARQPPPASSSCCGKSDKGSSVGGKRGGCRLPDCGGTHQEAGGDGDDDSDEHGHGLTPAAKRPHMDAQVPGATEEERVFRALQPTEKARLFSVREMLRLQGFPSTFAMPQGVTQRKGRALVGNSVNVEVVAHLLTFLFTTMAATSSS